MNWLLNRALHISHATTVQIAKILHKDPAQVQALENAGTALLVGKIAQATGQSEEAE